MEKQDIMYGVAALVVILIIAVVIKPMVTGQAMHTGLPEPTPEPTVGPVTISPPNSSQQIIPTTSPTPVPTKPPTPVQTWSPNSSLTVGFIDPSAYGISFNQSLPGGTRINDVPVDTNMTTIAKIDGQYSGTTQVIKMPFPYWEIWYTVDPFDYIGGKGQKLSSSTITGPLQSGVKGSGSSQTVIQSSYSVTIPTFSLQVMDANDPNRIVRTITPPGGLDKSLWKGISVSGEYSGDTVIPDPRPWKEKFFEGERNYYFVVDAHSVNSYSIEIRVPSRYIGKY
jgi:hypothetical protein